MHARRNFPRLGTLAFLIFQSLELFASGADRVARHTAVFTAPPRRVPTPAMPDGPLLGNGDVGVVLAGPPEAQVFHIGKNDFWTRHPADARIVTVGRVDLRMPGLAGASYRQEQDLARAEVRGVFSNAQSTVFTRAWVDANANLLLVELRGEGAPVPLSVRAIPGHGDTVPARVVGRGTPNAGREQHGGGRWYFDGELADLIVTNRVLAGPPRERTATAQRYDGRTTWHPFDAPPVSTAVTVSAWIRIASAHPEANYLVSQGEWNRGYSLGLSAGRMRWAIDGQFLQTKDVLPLDTWMHVAGTFGNGRMELRINGEVVAARGGGDAEGVRFTRKADDLPGRAREVAVVPRLLEAEGLDAVLEAGRPLHLAVAIHSDLDAEDFAAAADRAVKGLTAAGFGARSTAHRAWWADFWARSFIEIPDPEIEKRWYAALYVMGSCSRAGEVAPGLWGNWVTTDRPNWHGDFHLNYNFQAPFYGVYAANHADLSLPFYDAIHQSMSNGLAMARRHGWKGVHFPVCIGPWGLSPENPDGDWGQRSDAAFAALNFIWYWQYTQDDAWLRRDGYPYLREVAAFWEDYLTLEDGRYVIRNDAIHEGSGKDMNPLLSLGLVRTLFTNLLAMSETLKLDADRRAKWRDILDRLSAFPVQERDGRTVFRYTEQGMAWNNGNTLGIHHIFPAGAIGLDSDPQQLAVARNTIDAMHRWADYNGFSSWYAACARVGVDPATILAKMREQCDRHSLPNLLLYYGGGGIENCGGFGAVTEMLLQSHDGVVRLFPCWPKEQDARFGSLRAVGGFLVSAEQKSGAVTKVALVSEKGRTCVVQNPWPGLPVRTVRDGHPADIFIGRRLTLPTKPGETLALAPL